MTTSPCLSSIISPFAPPYSCSGDFGSTRSQKSNSTILLLCSSCAFWSFSSLALFCAASAMPFHHCSSRPFSIYFISRESSDCRSFASCVSVLSEDCEYRVLVRRDSSVDPAPRTEVGVRGVEEVKKSAVRRG